ncbi:MAG: hypothetical protein QOK67_09965 [Nitrososphaeraceae archaeon]|nr:hypothetical protein [Nitrososphaeraceae archaeon]
MYSKIYSIVISSILAFAVIAGIPKAFENITAQEDDTDITQGEDMNGINQGNESGMVQDQSNMAKNDGNNEEEEGDDE